MCLLEPSKGKTDDHIVHQIEGYHALEDVTHDNLKTNINGELFSYHN